MDPKTGLTPRKPLEEDEIDAMLAVSQHAFDLWTHKGSTVKRQILILKHPDDFYEAQKLIEIAFDQIEALATKREAEEQHANQIQHQTYN